MQEFGRSQLVTAYLIPSLHAHMALAGLNFELARVGGSINGLPCFLVRTIVGGGSPCGSAGMLRLCLVKSNRTLDSYS
jgi:hypothetical protein